MAENDANFAQNGDDENNDVGEESRDSHHRCNDKDV